MLAQACSSTASTAPVQTTLEPLRIDSAPVQADPRLRKPLCSVKTLQQVCAAATADTPSVRLSCSLDFKRMDCRDVGGARNVITRKLLFHGSEASHVHADFNGALIDGGPDTYNHGRQDMLEIASVQDADGQWQVPQHLTIRRVRINGSVRLFGMGRNGEALAVRQSSHRPDHPARVSAAAPRHIVLESLNIVGQGRNPLYLSPGVSHVLLRHSTIRGRSTRVGVYLDAETHHNHLLNNVFDVETTDAGWLGFYDRGWPQLALDGSSHNRVSNNTFRQMENGGIYLYRNCGEGGTIRYGTPSHNLITGNRFEYAEEQLTSRPSPAVFLGSRNYGVLENLMPGSHCNDDQQGTLRAGSALSNADFAQHNQVLNNRFIRLGTPTGQGTAQALPSVIKTGNTKRDTNNLIDANRWRVQAPEPASTD